MPCFTLCPIGLDDCLTFLLSLIDRILGTQKI